MTVAFDKFQATGGSGVTGNRTIAFVPVGTPKAVIVWVIQQGAGDGVSGVTYGSLPLTEVTGSPNNHTTGEAGVVYCYFGGASIPTGPQTVTVTVTDGTKKEAYCVTLTAAADTELVDVDATVNTDTGTNPSVTLPLGGRTCWAGEAIFSGQAAVTGITQFSSWTAQVETDFGTQVSACYTFDTIGSTDITAGWTQAVEDAVMIAVAVSEVVPSGPVVVAADLGSDGLASSSLTSGATKGSDATAAGAATPSLKGATIAVGTLTAPGLANVLFQPAAVFVGVLSAPGAAAVQFATGKIVGADLLSSGAATVQVQGESGAVLPPNVLWFSGFELDFNGTGVETGECVAIGTNSAFVTSPVHGGAYALAQTNTLTTLFNSTNSTPTPKIGFRFWFRKPANPGSAIIIFVLATSGSVVLYRIRLEPGGTLRLDTVGGFTQTSGTAVIANNIWTRISGAYDAASGGIGKVWVGDILDITITHTGAQANVANGQIGSAGGNPDWYVFDDILFWDSATKPPDGIVIARQGATGTPIDDAWPNKTGGATSAACWSDTPPVDTSLVDTGTTDSLLAQTMRVHEFSTTQTGHGAEVVTTSVTINGAKINVLAKDNWGASGNTKIRRYVNAAGPTDVDLIAYGRRQMSTVYHHMEVYFSESTPANLDLYEIGVYHPAGAFGAHITSVHEMWMQVDVLIPPPVTVIVEGVLTSAGVATALLVSRTLAGGVLSVGGIATPLLQTAALHLGVLTSHGLATTMLESDAPELELEGITMARVFTEF